MASGTCMHEVSRRLFVCPATALPNEAMVAPRWTMFTSTPRCTTEPSHRENELELSLVWQVASLVSSGIKINPLQQHWRLCWNLEAASGSNIYIYIYYMHIIHIYIYTVTGSTPASLAC